MQNLIQLYLLTDAGKVIIEKSRGEGFLMEQDKIENVSKPQFFFNFLRKKNRFFKLHSMPKMFSMSTMFFKNFFFAHENMKNPV